MFPGTDADLITSFINFDRTPMYSEPCSEQGSGARKSGRKKIYSVCDNEKNDSHGSKCSCGECFLVEYPPYCAYTIRYSTQPYPGTISV